MFVDARSLPDGATLHADLCIVGAGPAAITLALELTGRGLRVLLVESGAIEPQIRRKYLDIGSSVGHPYYNLMFTRARAFGGTSSRWHMHTHGDEGWMARPLDPIDFESRPGLPWSGWPIAYRDLEPYYRRAHSISDLGPDTFAADDWERPGMQRLPLRGSHFETTILQRGMAKFSRFRDEFAIMPDVTVLHHATVVDIVSAGEPPAVERVVAATTADRRFEVTARTFVLAAGGIENPRLLLASVGQQPDGLGNGNDLVGRFFMEHLAGRIGYVRPADRGLVSSGGLYDSHPEGSIFIQAALMPRPEVLRAERLLNVAFFLVPRTEAFVSEGVRSLKALITSTYRRPIAGNAARHVRNVLADAGSVARTIAFRFGPETQPDTVLAVRAQAEQAPHRESRIRLGRARDRYGVPRPVLAWKVSDSDIDSIRRAQRILDVDLRASGLGHLERMLGDEDPPVVFEGDHHHMGTTKMAADPRDGVVDVDCRVHGVRNLYVAGASVFPTGGWMNPTLTVVALAVRLADQLKQQVTVRP